MFYFTTHEKLWMNFLKKGKKSTIMRKGVFQRTKGIFKPSYPYILGKLFQTLIIGMFFCLHLVTAKKWIKTIKLFDIPYLFSLEIDGHFDGIRLVGIEFIAHRRDSPLALFLGGRCWCLLLIIFSVGLEELLFLVGNALFTTFAGFTNLKC